MALRVYTRNPLFAFFSFFAARFSIRLLAGFFFASFFVSIALLITGSSDWGEQLAFCAKVSRSGSFETRPIPSKPHAGGAAARTPAQSGRHLTRAGFQGLWLAHGDSHREHRDLNPGPLAPLVILGRNGLQQSTRELVRVLAKYSTLAAKVCRRSRPRRIPSGVESPRSESSTSATLLTVVVAAR